MVAVDSSIAMMRCEFKLKAQFNALLFSEVAFIRMLYVDGVEHVNNI